MGCFQHHYFKSPLLRTQVIIMAGEDGRSTLLTQLQGVSISISLLVWAMSSSVLATLETERRSVVCWNRQTTLRERGLKLQTYFSNHGTHCKKKERWRFHHSDGERKREGMRYSHNRRMPPYRYRCWCERCRIHCKLLRIYEEVSVIPARVEEVQERGGCASGILWNQGDHKDKRKNEGIIMTARGRRRIGILTVCRLYAAIACVRFLDLDISLAQPPYTQRSR